jgi:hypothetical protein
MQPPSRHALAAVRVLSPKGPGRRSAPTRQSGSSDSAAPFFQNRGAFQRAANPPQPRHQADQQQSSQERLEGTIGKRKAVRQPEGWR